MAFIILKPHNIVLFEIKRMYCLILSLFFWCSFILVLIFICLLVQRNSLCTIRNIANICCVQFSAHSSHLLAFGSADYKTYCYDLRNVSSPWCVLDDHRKAVSFVKFLDSETLVSASTDNTLKIWDLNKTSSTVLSTSSILTLKGHTNEKVSFSFEEFGYISFSNWESMKFLLLFVA